MCRPHLHATTGGVWIALDVEDEAKVVHATLLVEQIADDDEKDPFVAWRLDREAELETQNTR